MNGICRHVEGSRNNRTSLDFEHQKQTNVNPGIGRYKPSKNLSLVKKEYAGLNKVPNLNELPALVGSKSQIKGQIIKQLPIYLSLEKISKLSQDSPILGDHQSENALEAMMRFNEDMRTLSLSSYQLHELLELALQEHDQMIQWMIELEQMTLSTEEVMVTNFKKVKQAYNAAK